MDEKTKPEEETAAPTLSADETAALVRLALQMCNMVVMCAPTFAPGSAGAQTVQTATESMPRLAELISVFDHKANGGKEGRNDRKN
ncbi:MAG: hypothetical protein K6G94_09645 [Kiritimatiellae bacterium]|nr:hypothetical protein [Kiritimatiellia bacterium]